jgi:hypothetical protein
LRNEELKSFDIGTPSSAVRVTNKGKAELGVWHTRWRREMCTDVLENQKDRESLDDLGVGGSM